MIHSYGYARANIRQNQLGHHRMADPRVQERLKKNQRAYPNVRPDRAAMQRARALLVQPALAIVTDHRYFDLCDELLTLWGDTIEGA